MKRARHPEADVEGKPQLVVPDSDLEAVAELLAEALVAAVEREHQEPAS